MFENHTYMKNVLLPAVMFLGVLASCRGGDVLIDEMESEKLYETLPTFADVKDSTKLTVNNGIPWAISIAKGGDWCYASRNSGNGKNDNVTLYVSENTTSKERSTSLILTSESSTSVYRINQKAGPEWYETDFWHRTDLQKLGIRGNVRQIEETNATVGKTVVDFDRKGNATMVEHYIAGKAKEYIPDYTTTREFDEENRLVRMVTVSYERLDTTVTEFEYGNTGSLVATDGYLETEVSLQRLFTEGTIMRDLSAVHTKSADSTLHRVYEFRNGKLCQTATLMAGTDTVSCQTTQWELRGNMPYTHGDVLQVLYRENGMFSLIDCNGYRYRYDDNVRYMTVKSVADLGTCTRQGGSVMNAAYTFNQYHDREQGIIEVKDADNTLTEIYAPYYDHEFNWTNYDCLRYDTVAGKFKELTLIRSIIYYAQ